MWCILVLPPPGPGTQLMRVYNRYLDNGPPMYSIMGYTLRVYLVVPWSRLS